MRHRIPVRCTVKGLLSALLCGGPVACETLPKEPPRPTLPDRWPGDYVPIARRETLNPLIDQARNGWVLDHTLWDYHFMPAPTHPDEEENQQFRLHPGGRTHLDRLVRDHLSSSAPGPLVLYLQRTQEVSNLGEDRKNFATARAALDRRRVEELGGYLAARWANVPALVYLNDPQPDGMVAGEAILAYAQMRGNARGVLTPDVQGGISITPQKLLSGTGFTGPSGGVDSGAQSGTGGASALGSQSGD